MNEDTRRKLKDLALSETGFVFDPYTGTTFSVNGTGLRLLEWLKDEDTDREAIIDRLRETFEVGEADLTRDLDEFVRLLENNGILPEGFSL